MQSTLGHASCWQWYCGMQDFPYNVRTITLNFRWRNISPCHEFQKQEKILFFIGFRLQTCKKLWYLNIYLRFALENLFSFNISFSTVIFKGIIHPQSSQNEILGYSSWNLATPNSFKIRYSYSWLLLRQEAMSQRSRGKEDTALTSLNPCYFAYFLNQPFHSYVQNILSP